MFTSRSLFSSCFPENFIKTQQSPKSEIEYAYKDQLSDRFELLKVEAELQLSVLLGLFTLSGSGKYLCEEKKTEKVISCSLYHYCSTACDKLIASFSEIKEYVDENVFEDEQYTHVVVEINWGATCTLSLEHLTSDLNKKAEVEGFLKAELSKVEDYLGFKGKGDADYKKKENEAVKNTNLKLYADVLPDGNLPNTIEGAIDFINKIPELLKSVNNGKGKPLNYMMISLEPFKKLFNFNKYIPKMVKAIDESFIIELVSFFEDLAILKQKLNDLESEFAKYEKYLPDDCMPKIRRMQQEIKTNETKFKTDLAEDLPKVRAGETSMKDLIKKKERHKLSGLNVVRIEDFIEEFGPMRNKINSIISFLTNNVLYLGKYDDLDTIMNRKNGQKYFVLYTSSNLYEKNKELARKSEHNFRTEANKASTRKDESYILVDFDVNKKMSCDVQEVKIVMYRNGEIEISDVYEEWEAERVMNYARLKPFKEFIYVSYKPLKRIVLELMCPGVRKGTCSSDPLLWTCNICKNNLEYGFDNFFYCACGKAEANWYEFKCRNINHGNEFFPINGNFGLEKELDKLRPLKEMNIVILGQSGVGKSTWINSIVNYLQYETLEDAEKGGVECVIPAQFSVTYLAKEGQMQQIVKIGDDDPNEITSSGKSATQGPQGYNFILGDRIVRLIDTPGLGDTGGIDKDKENMKKILDYIGHLKEIHGICILLKPNETRIDALFRFCITELLCNLHRNAAHNILFCFTNSRSTFYTPGDTYTILNDLLKELKIDDLIALCERTIYCLDNEAFRFLCSLKYKNISQKEENRKLYHESWAISVKETKRLFNQIKELPPHKVSDTSSLCFVRNKILHLTRALGDVTQLIQKNLAAITNQEKEIESSEKDLKKLAEKLSVPNITLKSVSLKQARTVCTNERCVTLHHSKLTGITHVEYTTICHEGCSVRNVELDKPGSESIQYCRALKGRKLADSPFCKICGCHWQEHKVITYTQEPVETNEINKDVENEIHDKETAKAIVEKFKKQLEENTQKYQEEEKIIMQTSFKFGKFLKENAISPFNDSFQDYLLYLINQEEKKKKTGQTDYNLLEKYYKMITRYADEKEIFEKSMRDANIEGNLTQDDIMKLEKELYDLELTGKQIKEIASTSLESNRNIQTFTEKHVPIENKFFRRMKNKGKGIVKEGIKFWSKVLDYVE